MSETVLSAGLTSYSLNFLSIYLPSSISHAFKSNRIINYLITHLRILSLTSPISTIKLKLTLILFNIVVNLIEPFIVLFDGILKTLLERINSPLGAFFLFTIWVDWERLQFEVNTRCIRFEVFDIGLMVFIL